MKRDFIAFASERLGQAVKELLETKHLYQKISIADDVEAFWDKRKPSIPTGSIHIAIEDFKIDISQTDFFPSTTALKVEERTGETELVPTLILRNVKMLCIPCQEREAFSPVWHDNLNNELSKLLRRDATIPRPHRGSQIVYVAYQCQRCKGEPIGILLRREEWNVWLHGRSPMEEVLVPSFVPKPERHLYRDVLISMHAGKPLAALFYLRTFIEQFARRVTSTQGKETGDVIMEKYNETLPEKTRDSMPSLREWYGKLSEPIHTGRADEKLLQVALENIDTHFDLRRIHKVPSPSTKPQ